MFVFCLYFLFMRTILVNKDVYIGIDSDILCSGITVVSPAATKQPSINLLECKGNYSATYEVGTLAVDGWAQGVTFRTAMRGLGGAAVRPCPSYVNVVYQSSYCNILLYNVV